MNARDTCNLPKRLHDVLAAAHGADPSLSIDAQLCALLIVARDLADLHEQPAQALHGFAAQAAMHAMRKWQKTERRPAHVPL